MNTNTPVSILNQYKAEAGRIADSIIGPQTISGSHSLSAARGTLRVLKSKRGKGAHAALLGGLVVGALVERGHADKAEALTIELSRQAAIAK